MVSLTATYEKGPLSPELYKRKPISPQPQILKLSSGQLQARLSQLGQNSLSKLFKNINIFPSRNNKAQMIAAKIREFGIDTIKVDTECFGMLLSLDSKKIDQYSSLTDVTMFLAGSLNLKIVLLPETRTLYALAEPRNQKHFKALAFISPSERKQMEREQAAQILFYLLVNPFIGEI